MPRAILTNRIYIETDHELQNKLLTALTYKIPQYRDDLPPKIITNARIIKDGLMSIPSGRVDLIPENYQIINRRVVEFADFPEFRFELRDDQSNVTDNVVSDCFINANTSWGKTFTALYLAGTLGMKTLVIVHTLVLRNQWVKECEKVYGFTPSIIGSGSFDTSMPITVGNIQSLQRLPKNILEKAFGCVIVDECHHCPSRTFSTLLDTSHARYKIGLSASARRKDKLHVLFPDYFGTKVFKPPERNRLVPEMHLIKLPVRVADGELAWALKINELAENPEYQKMIALIAASYASKGHKVLVLSSRTKLLERAHEITPRSSLIIGTTKDREAELDKMRSDQNVVLYGSTNIFAEGISENYLSCLVIGTPINNEPLIDQLIGRVIRKHPGKLDPVVILPRLTGRVVEKQLQLMKNYFLTCGYVVKEL